MGIQTDPWDHARPGDDLAGWKPNGGRTCPAEANDTGYLCTRAPHPSEWKHIATILGGHVIAVWRDVEPDVGPETEPRGIAAGTACRRPITDVQLPEPEEGQ